MGNLEQTVSDAILQKSSEAITIDGAVYPITPATVATVIMVSELAAQLPTINKGTDNVLQEVLSAAKDCKVLGRIAATLILGAKRVKEERQKELRETDHARQWSWRKMRHVTREVEKVRHVPEIDYLAEKILDEVTNDTLTKLLGARLSLMQIGSFFELTTFLSGANLLRRTREVEETASGD